MCCLKASATFRLEIGVFQVASVSGPLSVRSGAKAPLSAAACS